MGAPAMEASGEWSRRRLLCLRAPDEASTLIAGLAAQGIDGHPLEVLRYASCWQQAPGALDAVRSLSSTDRVVLTSRRGVRAWVQLCAAAQFDATAVPVAVVGAATAEEARSSGLSVAVVGSNDALALAQMVAAMSAPSGRLLFAVAREAADEPQQFLSARGWKVERLETYAAVPVPDLTATISDLVPTAFDGVIATSSNRLATFVEEIPAEHRTAWLTLPFIVIGERTAERARLLGAAHIVVASGAATERLVDAAATLFSGAKHGENQ